MTPPELPSMPLSAEPSRHRVTPSAHALLAALFYTLDADSALCCCCLAGMPSGRVGADFDDMFDAADEAGGTLTAQIYEEHRYDGVPVLRVARGRRRSATAP
eukprot:6817119-Prymnesium_polylepis.1